MTGIATTSVRGSEKTSSCHKQQKADAGLMGSRKSERCKDAIALQRAIAVAVCRLRSDWMPGRQNSKMRANQALQLWASSLGSTRILERDRGATTITKTSRRKLNLKQPLDCAATDHWQTTQHRSRLSQRKSERVSTQKGIAKQSTSARHQEDRLKTDLNKPEQSKRL